MVGGVLGYRQPDSALWIGGSAVKKAGEVRSLGTIDVCSLGPQLPR